MATRVVEYGDGGNNRTQIRVTGADLDRFEAALEAAEAHKSKGDPMAEVDEGSAIVRIQDGIETRHFVVLEKRSVDGDATATDYLCRQVNPR